MLMLWDSTFSEVLVGLGDLAKVFVFHYYFFCSGNTNKLLADHCDIEILVYP